jgi:mannose-1-phosphate guanylyltransferase
MRAVILAGGRGTRLRPLTDNRPKPLIPFLGAPFAEGLLRRLRAVGATRATFLVGQEAEPFAPLHGVGAQVGLPVDVVTEEVPLDTAGAVRRLFAERLDEPALVCNGDILTDLDYADLLDRHRRAGAVVTIALTEVDDTSTFGVVVRDDDGWIERFVEKPPAGTLPDRTVNAGTYVLDPATFDHLPGDGPLSFEREVFPSLLEAGRRLLGVVEEAYWADLGTPRRYLDGQRAVLDDACHWPLPDAMERTGAPAAVHRTAQVHADAHVAAGTVIDRDCVVEAGVHLSDTALLPGVRVGRGARVRGAILGAGSQVPAGADVADGTVLADGEVAAR